MKRTIAFVLLLAVLISLTACTPREVPETTNTDSDTQGSELNDYASEEARLAQIRQEAEAFLKAHPDEMEALAEVMLRSHAETVLYQYYPKDDTLYWYSSGDHLPQGQLDDHPILDAAGFLGGTEVFDRLCVSDWELGSPGCVFIRVLNDPSGHPLYRCELIWCPDCSGDPADISKAAWTVEEILPGWYWYLEPTPDGPVVGADP